MAGRSPDIVSSGLLANMACVFNWLAWRGCPNTPQSATAAENLKTTIMPTSIPENQSADDSRTDKAVGCDALVSEIPAPEDPETRVWKSYVWHKDKCFFVSTITRNYDTYAGIVRGDETIVWAYDWKKAERGEMLHQAGGVHDHQQICRCLIAEGLFPDEDDPRTQRFCR